MSSAPSILQDRRELSASVLRRVLHALGIYVVLAALCVVGVLVSPEFLGPKNLLDILRSITLLGMVAVGVAFITYSKHYVDISIPAIMAFSGLAAISAQPLGIVPCLACGLAAGMLIGLVNGFAVGYMRLNPIIWTLAMAFMLDGFLRWAYEGQQIYPDPATEAGAAFLVLSQREVFGFFPYPTLVMLVVVAVGVRLMKRTRFGAQVQLTGAAYEVARTSGVNVRRVVLLVFLLSSLATSLAGLFLTSMNKQGTFETGAGYDFNAVTAVVIGGVGLSGGRGSILGVLGGVLVIGVLTNIMNLAGLDSYTQMVVKGIVFIAVVAVTTWLAGRSGRSDE